MYYAAVQVSSIQSCIRRESCHTVTAQSHTKSHTVVCQTMLLAMTTSALSVSADIARNVLFIAVDDMRPSIGAFNFSLAHTPHMDGLARGGLTFKRAFVQYAFCAPSRNSFMSGRRPDTTRVWNFEDHFREAGVGDGWRSLPEYFKSHGYFTAGSGKLFHPGVPPNNDWPRSWSPEGTYYSPECMPAGGGGNGKIFCNDSMAPHGSVQTAPSGTFACVSQDPPGGGYTLCPANTSKDEARFEYQLEDQRITDSCTAQLEQGANAVTTGSAPAFFVGCGFHKPHVPWVFPSEFLESFPADLADVPLANDTGAPVGMPDAAWHFPADVHGFNIGFNGTCNETRSRNFRRGYYAAVAYTDYNIGKVLAKLDALGLAASTAVVVFGDHGWQVRVYPSCLSSCGRHALFMSRVTLTLSPADGW